MSSVTAVDQSNVKSFDVEADMAEALTSQDPNSRPKYFTSTFQEYVFVFTVMMSAASTTFLQGVTVINTGTIGRDLNMSGAEITWISAALGLSSGSFVLLFGKTADLFGRKVQLLAGLFLLSVFALITSFAPNGLSLNILLGFLGLMTAAIAPPSIGILFTAYPPGTRRNMVTGALGCANPLGFAIGSISSGVATKYYSWRASFIFVAIFFVVTTCLAFLTVPSIPRVGNIRTMVTQFDYLGTVLTVTGITMISAALTEAPGNGWKSPKVLAVFMLGLILVFSFTIWEHIYSHPLVDPSIWMNRNFNFCILCVFFGYMSFITNQFWVSLHMQDIQQLSPLHIAARLLPQTVTGVIWSYIAQALVSRVSGTIIMAIGAAAYVLGATLLIFISGNTSYWALLFPSLCITVMGADFQFVAANLYINTQMPDQSSLGAGVLQTAMRLSISLGLAITTAVFWSTPKTQTAANVNLPYKRAYFCTILFAVIGLLFVPFMRIGKQGDRTEPEKNDVESKGVPRIRGEHSDGSHLRHINVRSQQDGPFDCESSTLTINTMATIGSQRSYLPRWSWEDELLWKSGPCSESNISYEVCIKCLQERKIVVVESEEFEKELSHHSSKRRVALFEPEIPEQGLAQTPQDGIKPKHPERRTWQCFPVVRPVNDVEIGDVSSGGKGWI